MMSNVLVFMTFNGFVQVADTLLTELLKSRDLYGFAMMFNGFNICLQFADRLLADLRQIC